MVHCNHVRSVIVLHDKTFKLSAVWILRRHSRVKCFTHTLMKAELWEGKSWILRGKLKGLTVLRVLSARLMKSDASAKLAGLNLRVSWKSIWKLDEVFTTYVIRKLWESHSYGESWVQFAHKFWLEVASNSILLYLPWPPWAARRK